MQRPGLYECLECLTYFEVGMKLFIGTKTVLAEPMTNHKYFELTHADPMIEETGEAEGYLLHKMSNEGSSRDWMEKASFEQHFEATDKGMSFSHALVLLESGHLLAQKGDEKHPIHQREGCIYTSSMHLFTPSQQAMQAKDWLVVE